MRNIYIINEYISSTKNGIGTFLRAYISCLKRIGTNICLITFNSPQKEFSISYKKGIKHISFPEFAKGEFLDYPKIVEKFFRLYIEDTSDNIFCFNHSPCNKLLQAIKQSHPFSKIIFIIHDQFWTGPFWGDSNKLRVLVKNREYASKTDKQWLKCFDDEKEIYEIANAVVCLSPDTEYILKYIYQISPSKIQFIPNGLSKRNSTKSALSRAQLRKLYAIDEQEKIIIFAGRLSNTKGMPPLIQAFKSVIKHNPHVRLVIAGSMLEHSFRYFTSIVATKTAWTGQLSPNELHRWYRMADIGILPSYTEQCSYTGIEMMMYGLPVVASDGYGVRNMFYDGVNAVIAPIGRRKYPKDFTNNLTISIINLLSSDECAKQLSKNTLKIFQSKYSINKMRKAYDILLNSL